MTLGGTSLKKEKRHPTLEDHVMVSAGAAVIGPVTIGRGSRIGAGAVVVSSAPPYSTIVGIPGKIVEGERTRSDFAELDHARLPDPVARAMSNLVDKINQFSVRLEEMEERQDCLEDKLPAPRRDVQRCCEGALAATTAVCVTAADLFNARYQFEAWSSLQAGDQQRPLLLCCDNEQPSGPAQISNGDFAAQVFDGAAGDRDPIAQHFDPELSAACRELPRAHRPFAELRGPVRSQRAMSGTGDGILRDTGVRGEESRDEINLVPRADTMTAKASSAAMREMSGRNAVTCSSESSIARTSRASRTSRGRMPSAADERIADFYWFGRPCGKIHAEQTVAPADCELATARREAHPLRVRPVGIQDDVGRRQSRMTAQIDLDGRREPSQGHDFGLQDHESGFREIILGRHRGHHLVR